ncbi:MAG: hypothetical protein KDH20_18555 [Rhodocyclaceae bacterium]|nr:hypothetical protein [Rhodocyclaceae bacterium]
MDLPTFVIELLKATLWPLTALTIAVIYRPQLSDLLLRVRKGKVGPAEFEFEQRVAELQAHAALALEPSTTVDDRATAAIAAAGGTREAVLAAWREIESAAIELGQRRLELEPVLGRSPLLVLRKAAYERIIPRDALVLFTDLRALRNRVAGDAAFTPAEDATRDFLSLVADLASTLETATQGDGK